ncbi:hypothetical protein FZEAL_6569 [Fusarium zealandicum]|uniref:Oxidoreductase n=1 Tax=Fusarium zealandicum TaxID=1053134 RepID=A0A8H4XIR9_9HYPO|nr:hypothetical protein FZEAL_6569 [Fusarium zealandicum]
MCSPSLTERAEKTTSGAPEGPPVPDDRWLRGDGLQWQLDAFLIKDAHALLPLHGDMTAFGYRMRWGYMLLLLGLIAPCTDDFYGASLWGSRRKPPHHRRPVRREASEAVEAVADPEDGPWSADAKMAPIGVALIGGGLFAKQEHMPALMKCDNLALKAIYSRSLKSAKETAALNTRSEATPDLYSADSGPGKSYDDLLARDDIAAVILALPIPSQPAHIEAALAAGKHVLAEKPLAPSVDAGKKLIDYYRDVAESKGVTFAIAENFRFKPVFEYAAAEAAKLGKVEHFSVRVFYYMGQDTQWYGTEWRAKPEFQGGFLLDGGVHFTAATRMLLTGHESRAAEVTAFTAQVQAHLPPIDTVNAVVRLESGVSGTYQQSCGTRLSASAWEFGYERGTVCVVGDKVTVTPRGGDQTVKEFERTSGVSEEVAAWATALVEGKSDERQAVDKALGDLEMLELMFESGLNGGEVKKFKHQ